MVDNIIPRTSHNEERFKYTTNNYPSYNTYNPTSSTQDHDHINYQDEDVIIKEQDRLLPIANVARIMKQILPPNAKISKEAKETMQECVSEFISFVTGEASDKCHKEKRKTVNGDDICWALGSLGFDEYFETLKRYLNKYREADGERANQNKGLGMSYHDEEGDHEPSDGRGSEDRMVRIQGVSTATSHGFNLM